MRWVVGVVVVIVLLATYVTWTAARVDRLHARATGAVRALDAQLLRRAAAAAVFAEQAGAADLYASARAALDADPDEREMSEDNLTKQLRELPLDAEGMDELVIACRRVGIARQVHNDLVRDALAVRRRRLVRLLRLTRRHPAPAYFDVDDPTLDAS